MPGDVFAPLGLSILWHASHARAGEEEGEGGPDPAGEEEEEGGPDPAGMLLGVAPA